MTMLIIEGADNVGKTTIAKRLAERLGYEYRHEGPPPVGVDVVRYYLERMHDDVVQDRFHWGEIVYGALTDRGTTLRPIDARTMMKRCTLDEGELLPKTLVVVLYAEKLETLVWRAKAKGEEFRGQWWLDNQVFRALGFFADLSIAIDGMTPDKVCDRIVSAL